MSADLYFREKNCEGSLATERKRAHGELVRREQARGRGPVAQSVTVASPCQLYLLRLGLKNGELHKKALLQFE